MEQKRDVLEDIVGSAANAQRLRGVENSYEDKRDEQMKLTVERQKLLRDIVAGAPNLLTLKSNLMALIDQEKEWNLNGEGVETFCAAASRQLEYILLALKPSEQDLRPLSQKAAAVLQGVENRTVSATTLYGFRAKVEILLNGLATPKS
jgi:hypothetical protein